jgi:hypothetical protein
MNAKELRIGNMVIDHEWNYYHRVKATELSFGDEDGGIGFEPIPLTEEILLRCGFKKVYDGKQMSELKFGNILVAIASDSIQLYFFFGEEMQLIFDDHSAFQYLHQLQNLFFALTGKELQVNL